MSKAHRLFGLFLMILPAACTGSFDSEQVRICRLVIPALHMANTEIRELRTSGLGPREFGVRIDYAAREPAADRRIRRIDCRFAGPANSPGGLDLIGVETDQERLGTARLLFLKRFWLAERQEPAVQPLGAEVPQVSRDLAYGIQQFINALAPSAIYALLATAYSVIYGLIRRINLAFGHMAVIGGYGTFAVVGLSAAVASANPIMGLVLACIAAATLSALWSALIGGVVITPLLARHREGQPILVATIAAAIAVEEGLRLAQGPRERWLGPLFNDPVALLRADSFVVTVTAMQLFVTGVALVSSLGLLLFMRWSRYGREWRAFADDPGMAALLGVGSARLLAMSFGLAGLLAGLAGWITAIHYGTIAPAQGTIIGLKALAAAIIGGIGSLPGAFAGGVLVGFFEAFWAAYSDLAVREVALFAMLVLVLVLRPAGLLGMADPVFGGAQKDQST